MNCLTNSPAIDGRFLVVGTASNWTCCCLSLPELSSSDSNAGEDDLSSSFCPFLSVVSALFFLSLLLTSLPLWWSTDNFLFVTAVEELFLLSFCTCSSEEPSWPLDLSFVSCAVVGVIANFSALILDSALDVVIPIPAARPCYGDLNLNFFV